MFSLVSYSLVVINVDNAGYVVSVFCFLCVNFVSKGIHLSEYHRDKPVIIYMDLAFSD